MPHTPSRLPDPSCSQVGTCRLSRRSEPLPRGCSLNISFLVKVTYHHHRGCWDKREHEQCRRVETSRSEPEHLCHLIIVRSTKSIRKQNIAFRKMLDDVAEEQSLFTPQMKQTQMNR